MVIVGGAFEVEPDQREEFLAGRHDAMRRSRAESGCLEYTLSADPSIPAESYCSSAGRARKRSMLTWPHRVRGPRRGPPPWWPSRSRSWSTTSLGNDHSPEMSDAIFPGEHDYSLLEIQVKAARIPVMARTASDDEKARLWKIMTDQWPNYDVYQSRTERVIPLVVLSPR